MKNVFRTLKEQFELFEKNAPIFVAGEMLPAPFTLEAESPLDRYVEFCEKFLKCSPSIARSTLPFASKGAIGFQLQGGLATYLPGTEELREFMTPAAVQPVFGQERTRPRVPDNTQSVTGIKRPS